MDKKCIESGLWEINGIQVRQLQSSVSYGAIRIRPWLIIWEPGKRSERVTSLKRAIEVIAAAQ